MMTLEGLKKDKIAAMKAYDGEAVTAYNALISRLMLMATDPNHGKDISEADIVSAASKTEKELLEEQENFRKAGRAETVAALEKHGLPTDPLLITYSGDGTDKYVELIGKLLKRGVDALFCPGGNAGILALYALSLFNRRIPEDISLIASEQTFFSRFAVPPQTTITPDYPALARTVADVLTRWLDNEPLVPAVTLPYQLLVRESVRS